MFMIFLGKILLGVVDMGYTSKGKRMTNEKNKEFHEKLTNLV